MSTTMAAAQDAKRQSVQVRWYTVMEQFAKIARIKAEYAAHPTDAEHGYEKKR